ncbi:FMN-binding glutamate synthase family protein [Vreelandella jeotgali]|uniref:FMN-binding glutamate synthase family protein n=1 Tax=Vreelandella jeotgali TaxID=553386 RepID=UPI00034B99AD|nr:FMN-binding glutamate synthase family protein [Halomonas jeotgali]
MFGKPRIIYYAFLVLSALLGIILAFLAPQWLWLWCLLPVLGALGAWDLASRSNVLRNYPVIGHMRYLFEFIRPEMRQYFFESDVSGRPFNRAQRDIVNARAKGEGDTSPFGTRRDMEDTGFHFVQHSMAPRTVAPRHARVTIGNAQCRQPYSSSRLNISAMSFGSLSGNAVAAMNRGARLGGFAQDTGEGAISPYHEAQGGDLIWEIGSGYFGCRNDDGTFNAERFGQKATLDQVRMVELKISQGAKPGHGGLLPGSKVNREIASTREIPEGQDCASPGTHPEFDTPVGMLRFLQRLRELSDGKPVGFKLCIGQRHEFMAVCKAMLDTGIVPDFITVDGAEGGTGAAPTEFSDFIGTYIDEALPFVHNCLVGIGKRDEITVIASGKVAMGFDMVEKLALGADMCNAARAFMFSVGCIQALRCHANTCPTGVATQDPARSRSLDVESKGDRVYRYQKATVDSLMDIVGSLGLESPDELGPQHIFRRSVKGPSRPCTFLHPSVKSGAFLDGDVPEEYAVAWEMAHADHF